MTDATDLVSQLVREKDALEAGNTQLFDVIRAVIATIGKPNEKGYEVRVSKATLEKMKGWRVLVKPLKVGGIVVTLVKEDAT